MSVSQGIKTRENNTIDSKSLVKLDLKSKYSGLWGLVLFYFTGYLRLVAGIKMDSLKQNKSLRPVLLTERPKKPFFSLPLGKPLFQNLCFDQCLRECLWIFLTVDVSSYYDTFALTKKLTIFNWKVLQACLKIGLADHFWIPKIHNILKLKTNSSFLCSLHFSSFLVIPNLCNNLI